MAFTAKKLSDVEEEVCWRGVGFISVMLICTFSHGDFGYHKMQVESQFDSVLGNDCFVELKWLICTKCFS